MISATSTHSFHEVFTETEWRALLPQVAFVHMSQTWAFGESKRAEGFKPRRVAIKLDDKPVAICQVLYKFIAGIPAAARINQGPMMLSGFAAGETEVIKAVRNRWRFLRRGLLLIAPALPNSPDNEKTMLSMGFRRRSQFSLESSRVDLTCSEQDMRKTLDSKWRNQLKKSESNNLQLTVSSDPKDVEWMLEIHREHVTSKNFADKAPTVEVIRALYAAAPADFLVCKAIHNNSPVAALVAYKFAGVAQYYIGWYGKDGRNLNAGNFLLWNVSLTLKAAGVTHFDLGGHSGNHNYSKFKVGMNGAAYKTAGEFFTF
jgi:lipid II:glycine glycyltransferase (peptidoglycan interpeptide bridge formation enzyme)